MPSLICGEAFGHMGGHSFHQAAEEVDLKLLDLALSFD
jgi:hypothetical protein